MRKRNTHIILLLFVSIFFLNITAVCQENPTAEELIENVADRRISMDFQDANLKDVLKIFSQQAGLNFIASQQIEDRTVTLYLEDVSVEDALDKLLAANNLSYDLFKNIFIVKEWGLPLIETVTKVIPLRHARVSNSALSKEISEKLDTGNVGTIEKSIKEILTKSGKIVEDPRTNSLVVTDIPSQFFMIEQTIESLDMPVPQILVEVEMLDVSKDAVEDLGVEWSGWNLEDPNHGVGAIDISGRRDTAFPFTGNKGNDQDWLSTFTSPGGVEFTNLLSSQFAPSILTLIGHELVLNFFKQRSDTKYLARPRVLSLANETAEIKLTADETVGTTTVDVSEGTRTATTEAERHETGVFLRFTPQVHLDTGEITMFLEPRISETRASNMGTSFRDPEDRGTKSVVRIKDGETIMIGGLLRTRYDAVERKIPILGDIPILGWFFKHKDITRDEDRELIVFLTPHIIKEDKDLEIVGLDYTPEREQLITFNREDVINRALKRWERK